MALVSLRRADVEPAGQRRTDHEHHHRRHGQPPGPRRGSAAEATRRRRRRGSPTRQMAPGAPRMIQRRHQQQAARARAQEVGRVHGVDAGAQSRDRERDRGAAREERQGGRAGRPRSSARCWTARSSGRREAAPGPPAPGRSRPCRQSVDGEQPLGREVAPSIAHQEDVDAARAQAEERDRDRHEREVVVHRDREDARERQLGHQQRAGNQRDADEGTGGNRRGHASVCSTRH